MSKNPNNRKKAPRTSEPMTAAMKVFLAGCVAELYLLIVRRCYINGFAESQIAWFDYYLFAFGFIGLAVLAISAVLALRWKENKKKAFDAWCVAGIGALVSASSLLTRWSPSAYTVFSIVVPVALILVILWSLYDRECALSLSVLGASLVLLWMIRRAGTSPSALYVKVLAVIYLAALVAMAVLAKKDKLSKLLPANADLLSIFVSCGISVVAIALALVSTALAYYAMWALAMVVFALAVFYTVKQL